MLRFKLGSIPVRVEPTFWLMSAVLGWSGHGVREVLIWIACVFVGVLAHELGHALASLAYGGKPEITLYAMGGLTRAESPRAGRWGWVVVSLAGPFAGFVFGALVLAGAVVWLSPPAASLAERIVWVWNLASHSGSVASVVVGNLLWINLGWGAVNLVPVLPLDGGNVARVLLGRGDAGHARALVLSIVAGIAVAVAAFIGGMTWAAILFALFTAGNVRQLKDAYGRAADARDGMPQRWERAAAAFDEGRHREAAELALGVARGARSPALRSAAAHMAGLALLQEGRAAEAWEALNLAPAGQLDPTLAGACLLEMGRAADAVRYLEAAVQHGAGPQAWELLAAAHDACGEHEQAAQVRARDPNKISP